MRILDGWVLAAAALTAASAMEAQSARTPKRALAIEDYYRVATVSAPELSPDGQWVVFLLTSSSEDTGTDHREAWVVPTDGGGPKRVSPEAVDVDRIGWARGGRIRYVAAGAARFVTPDGVVAPDSMPPAPEPILGPGDARAAVVRPLRMSGPPRRYQSPFEQRHFERFKGPEFDWLEFQRDGVPLPAPDPTKANPAEVAVTDTPDGRERRLTNLWLVPRDLTWSPTGSFLVFGADSGMRTEGRYGRNQLWSVTLEGLTTLLTPDDGLDRRSPAISPDGRWIAFVASYGTEKVIAERLNHGGPTDLLIIPAAGGAARNLTAEWDLQAGAPTWSADGRALYFGAAIGGERHLFRVAAAGGPVDQATSGPRRLNAITFDRAMNRMAYLVGRREGPAEIYVANLDGSGERRLTRFSEPLLAEIEMGRSERIGFRSADGTPIEGWVTLPHGYRSNGGPYPLIVTSHGGPHAASGYDFNFKTQYFAANGYLVLETNFRSSTGYGEQFLWGTWGEWGTRDGQDVVAGVDYVIANYPVDRTRVGATGHSYGGFMTNWLITQYPDRFAAAATGAGISNWMSDYGTADVARTKETEFFGTPWEEASRARMLKQSPLIYAGRVRTPTLFVHGALDQRVPYEEAEQMYVALKKNGVPAKMIVYPDQYHGIRGSWNVVHRILSERDWWNRWLAPRNAP